MADPRAELAGHLQRWLADRGEPARVEITARTTVGLSQETWLGTVHDRAPPAAGAEGSPVRDRPSGVARPGPGIPIVLRLPTPASGARAILAQRAALQAVAGQGLPVPGLLWFDDTGDNGFGRPFIVMARAPGRVPVGWDELPEPERSDLAAQAIDALAALHRIELAATPLAAAPPCPQVEFDGLARLIARLAPLPPVADAALWWLARHRPAAPSRRTIVHGDYRMGNMVVEHGRITGILDWEMAAPGDPVADLAWCFVPVWERPGVGEAALIRRYETAAGVVVDPDHFRWQRVMAFLRLSYYALSATRAFDAGRSTDLRLAALRLHLPVRLHRLASAMAGRPVT